MNYWCQRCFINHEAECPLDMEDLNFDAAPYFICPLCGEAHHDATWQDECEYHRGSERGSEPEAPSHYARFGSRILDLCALLPFFEGSIVKYVCRHKEKGGREDLLKAREYVDLLIEQYKERG